MSLPVIGETFHGSFWLETLYARHKVSVFRSAPEVHSQHTADPSEPLSYYHATSNLQIVPVQNSPNSCRML